MEIARLQLFDFKNHPHLNLEFCNGVNVITGKNGTGKTNILDAVFFLANAKSYFNALDSQLIRNEAEFFSVKGWFQSEAFFEIQGSFSGKGKKTFKKNEKNYDKLIDHIGLIQTVLITPYDIAIILEGSDERRKFIDITLCQTHKEYLVQLSRYKKLLDSRNKILKQFEGRPLDPELLEAIDNQLIPCNEYLFQTRKVFIEEFSQLFIEDFLFISPKEEKALIAYHSDLHEKSMKDLIRENFEKDRILCRTNCGIHKDDLIFEMNGMSLKRFGSQGQIKSFVIALHLAQHRYYKLKTQQIPILLLDDIFEKIDEYKAQKLMERISSRDYHQIFITDTHQSRVKAHLSNSEKPVSYFELPIIQV